MSTLATIRLTNLFLIDLSFLKINLTIPYQSTSQKSLLESYRKQERQVRGKQGTVEFLAKQKAVQAVTAQTASNFHGRGDWIRTSDHLNPIQVRYQAALRPDS